MKSILKAASFLKGRTSRAIAIFAVIIILLAGYLLARNKYNMAVEHLKEQPVKADMVILDEFIPGIQINLLYATDNNVYGRRIYDIDKAYLRRNTAEKLRKAQAEFIKAGYSIKVWDAYRPPEAQYKLWEAMPDARYVVNPYRGFSYHSRGVAVDITLVNAQGEDVDMPSGFDDFTGKADRDYSDIDGTQAINAELLEQIMVENGFRSIYYEWWHFIDTDGEGYGVVNKSRLPN